jgi:hypothetical protein
MPGTQRLFLEEDLPVPVVAILVPLVQAELLFMVVA